MLALSINELRQLQKDGCVVRVVTPEGCTELVGFVSKAAESTERAAWKPPLGSSTIIQLAPSQIGPPVRAGEHR
jgi:hypothetical protein